jgi:hypothetical protein
MAGSSTYRILVLAIVAALAIGACSDDDVTGPGDVPEMSVLGMGYDVFSNYADPAEVCAGFLDVEALYRAGHVEKVPYEKSTFRTAHGTSIREYSTNLSSSVSVEGGYLFFSGAAKMNFSSSRYTSERYSFATVQSLIQKYAWRVKRDVTLDQLRPYVLKSVQQRLDDPDFSCEDLFYMYGTHVITGFTIGGRLDYSVSAEMSEVKHSSSIDLYAEASFKKGFASASLSTETHIEEDLAAFESIMEKHLQVYGGRSEYGQHIINDEDYRDWIDSVEERPVFCDFEDNGLFPIWEFCTEPERKSTLHEAFEAHAEDNEILIHDSHLALVDLTVRDMGSNPPQNLEGGWRLLPQDLNEDAGGRYLWIYYRLGSDDDPDLTPIDRVYTVNTSDNERDRFDGTKINIDLNKGAGGDYIYLYYTRGGVNPIRALHSSADGKTRYTDYASPSLVWLPVCNNPGTGAPQDLCEGAGGDYIYLYYTKDFVD